MNRAPRLPPAGHLQRTGPVDWIGAYDATCAGFLFRRRLAWAAAQLPERLGHVLEVGYGSGVFQYELAARAAFSVGIDIHHDAAAVRNRLASDGVHAALLTGSGIALPFRAESFDAVVLLSTLEFVPDPATCLRECLRVLRPDGRLVCIRPRQLLLADLAFRWLLGQDPEAEFNGGRARVESALGQVLPKARRLRRPVGFSPLLAPYELVVSEKRDAVDGSEMAGAENSGLGFGKTLRPSSTAAGEPS